LVEEGCAIVVAYCHVLKSTIVQLRAQDLVSNLLATCLSNAGW